MFLRRNRRVVEGESYEYWTLVETYRTAKGPRQRLVASLGKSPGLEAAHQRQWADLDLLLEGAQPGPVQLELPSPKFASADSKPFWAEVDLGGLRVERVRDFGQVYLGLSLWRRLGLHTLLRQVLPAGQEDVPWDLTACILALARFCGQKSELAVAEGWYAQSALDDVLDVPSTQINEARLYRGLDAILPHRLPPRPRSPISVGNPKAPTASVRGALARGEGLGRGAARGSGKVAPASRRGRQRDLRSVQISGATGEGGGDARTQTPTPETGTGEDRCGAEAPTRDGPGPDRAANRPLDGQVSGGRTPARGGGGAQRSRGRLRLGDPGTGRTERVGPTRARGLSLTNQLHGDEPGGAVAVVYATDPGRGCVPDLEERLVSPTGLPPED